MALVLPFLASSKKSGMGLHTNSVPLLWQQGTELIRAVLIFKLLAIAPTLNNYRFICTKIVLSDLIATSNGTTQESQVFRRTTATNQRG